MADARTPAARAGVTFEVERLERDGDKLIVSGHWSGLRGVRFVRPTLVIGDREVLATLEHKPWTPRADRAWTAAFPWKGSTPDASQLALAVAPSVTVPLGPPGGEPEPTLVLVPGEAAADGESPPPAPAPAAKPTKRRPPAKRAPKAAASAPAKRAPKRAEPAVAKTAPKGAEPAAVKQAPKAAESAPASTAPKQPEVAPEPSATNARMRARLLEQELEAVVAERDALRGKLDEAETLLAAADTARADREASLRRERRSADAAADERDDIARARIAAERDRDLALGQRDEAVKDREAAVRARMRMELQRDEAIETQAVAAAEIERAKAERDEANAQRDEVLLAYRALQRHVQTERAGLDRAQSDGGETAGLGPDEPLGVRRMPAARTVMAELQRPPRASKFVVSKFDVWVFRVLGSIAAGCFILLLVSIARLFL
jgi:hypothetical protein